MSHCDDVLQNVELELLANYGSTKQFNILETKRHCSAANQVHHNSDEVLFERKGSTVGVKVGSASIHSPTTTLAGSPLPRGRAQSLASGTRTPYPSDCLR